MTYPIDAINRIEALLQVTTDTPSYVISSAENGSRTRYQVSQLRQCPSKFPIVPDTREIVAETDFGTFTATSTHVDQRRRPTRLVVNFTYTDAATGGQHETTERQLHSATITGGAFSPPTRGSDGQRSPDSGATGTLDGTGSTDNSGTGIATYLWEQVDGIGRSNLIASDSPLYASLTNADSAQASFIVPSLNAENELDFKLTVTDNVGNTASTWVSFDINADTTDPFLSIGSGGLTAVSGATVELGDGVSTR